jgi:hypothetical protein
VTGAHPLGGGNLTLIRLNLSVISSADDLCSLDDTDAPRPPVVSICRRWVGALRLGLGEWNTRMSKFEHYRRNAEEAQRQADRATSNEIRAAWLQIVQGWLALLPKRALSQEQVFDVQLKA